MWQQNIFVTIILKQYFTLCQNFKWVFLSWVRPTSKNAHPRAFFILRAYRPQISTQISQENWVGRFIFGQLWRRERFESKNRNREVFDSRMAFNFDDVFVEIGGVGRYQALRYVILSCIPICMSWHLLGTIKIHVKNKIYLFS